MSNTEAFMGIGEDDIPFVQFGKYIFKLDLEDLDEEFRERARVELREIPEVVEEALVRMKTLLEGEEDLNLPVGEDDFFITFLRPCKFYPESAFKLLTRFFKFKIKYPEIGNDWMPSNVRHAFEHEVLQLLPNRCQDGTRIMIVHGGAKWNPKTVTLIDFCRSIGVALQIAMLEPKTQVAGGHVIVDLKGLGLHHVWQFSPSIARSMAEFVQECLPVRIKGIHVVNQPYIFKVLYAIFKPFVGEKLRHRLFFHGYDRKALHSCIPKEDLPACYDGTSGFPEIPGHLIAEMLCQFEREFELFNAIGYTKDKLIVDSEVMSTTKLQRARKHYLNAKTVNE